MLNVLKELLEDLKIYEKSYYDTYIEENDKRIIALESAIEVLERLRNEKN